MSDPVAAALPAPPDPAAQSVGVRVVDFADHLRANFLTYAEYVIKDRAIPDLRDGLKPVHRRLLWTMWEDGCHARSPYRKVARVVGSAMGKYHPHGDSALCDALVRLAQPFSMVHTLVDGKGNFGSIDNDPHAAARYIECRLSAFAEAALFADIGSETVAFGPNYDGSEQEPLVLPSRLPLILLTAPAGIAVGMATSILPYNLGEVCDALMALVKDPALPVSEVQRLMPAPDFPLGGLVTAAAENSYRHGHGPVLFRATAEVESEQIILTSVPPHADKSALVSELSRLAREDLIQGVKEVRDESTKSGIRVVIEIDRRADPNAVLNALYESGNLQTSHSLNLVAIVDRKPRQLGLLDVFKRFLSFRREVVTKRTKYELKQATERLELVQAVLKAVANKNKVMVAVEGSNPQTDLQAWLGLSVRQADYVLGMALRRFSQAEVAKANAENQELTQAVTNAQALIADKAKVDEVILAETAELKARFAVTRRTTVVSSFSAITAKDMVKPEDVVLTFLDDGTVKSTPLEDYRVQRRAGRGSNVGVKAEEGAKPVFVATCNTHDDVMLMTDQGNRYKLPGFAITPQRRGKRAAPITEIVPAFQPTERVVAVIKSVLADNEVLVVVGDKCQLKKQSAASLTHARDTTTKFFDCDRGGKVVGAVVAPKDSDLVLVSEQARVLRTSLAGIREVKGRETAGVKVFGLKPDDRVLSVSVADLTGQVLTVTTQGFAKRTPMASYQAKGRRCSGVRGHALRSGDKLLYGSAVMLNEDAGLFLVSSHQLALRMRLEDVRETASRSSLGTRLKRMEAGEVLVSAVVE